jgi:hypothetical protein
MAVGARGADQETTLTERFNGRLWSVIPSRNPAGSQNDVLNSVSCVSARFCIAVGREQIGTYDQALIERWNGTSWKVVPSPSVPSSKDNVLLGVSCTSSRHCVAGGFFDDSTGTGHSLIETLNGRSWTITPSQDRGSAANELASVSCASSTACVAVGHWVNATSPGLEHAYIETLKNGAWSLSTTPSPAGGADLYGVSCKAANACTAVGYYNARKTERTLIETLTGAKWSITASPNVGSRQNRLSALSCSSAKACVAVGHYFSADADRTLVEIFRRGSWRTTESANRTSSANELLGVSCPSSSCVAAGVAAAKTLVEIGA